VMFALFLVAFAGGTAKWVYISAPVALAASIYWLWRYRALFG
jgi:hypothetical protein